MSCQVLKILESGCSCLLKYENCGKICTFNLEGAYVKPFCGGFNIYGNGCGLKVSDESDFTWQDVEALICECSGSNNPSGTEDDPISVDITGAFCPCDETPDTALPVKIVCDQTTSIQLACAEETGELLYIDTNVFPPVAYNFDGSFYEGTVVDCQRELKYIEQEFCSDDGVTIKVICWNVLDPAGSVQTIWILPDGTITDQEPADLVLCSLDCDPFVTEFTADDSTNTQPYNSIEIVNPTCCKLTVTTSAGDFSVLPKGNNSYSIRCLDWDCNLDPEITITAEDEECLTQVLVTIRRRK